MIRSKLAVFQAELKKHLMNCFGRLVQTNPPSSERLKIRCSSELESLSHNSTYILLAVSIQSKRSLTRTTRLKSFGLPLITANRRTLFTAQASHMNRSKITLLQILPIWYTIPKINVHSTYFLCP